jgi:DNA repair exonuclease SbcCD ATPase subunit
LHVDLLLCDEEGIHKRPFSMQLSSEVVCDSINKLGDTAMSWISDLLKEIPLTAVLREKIATIEEKQAALETENAILKDDKRKLQARILELEHQLQALTKSDAELTDVEVALLQCLTNKEVHEAEQMAAMVKSNLTRVEYHLHKLIQAGYVGSPPPIVAGPAWYYLEHKGREYLVERNLA